MCAALTLYLCSVVVCFVLRLTEDVFTGLLWYRMQARDMLTHLLTGLLVSFAWPYALYLALRGR